MRRSPLFAAVLGGLLVLFVVGPVLRLLFAATPESLLQALRDPEVLRAMTLTLLTSAAATGIGLLLGVPLAYLLARRSFPGKRIIEWVIELPIVIPHPVAGLALILWLGRQSTIGGLLGRVGIEVVTRVPGIIAAMLFVSAPILVSGAREAFRAVDPTLERVARSLGDTPWAAFRRVTWPLARRGVGAAAILAGARAVSEFGAIVLITYHPSVASVLIFDRFNLYGLSATLPIAVLLLLLALAVRALLDAARPRSTP
jgi:molybdate/tungstate transport system permease protein